MAYKKNTESISVNNPNHIRSTSLHLDRSYNEIEKSKGFNSQRYPSPHEIKQSLGNHIGNRVVDLIPKDIFQKFKFDRIDRIPPTDFEVTTKNVLSGNIKLTTTDITDDTEINLTRVKTVGYHSMGQTYLEFEDKLFDERNAQLNKWVEEKKEKNIEDNLQIEPIAKHKYKMESTAILEEYNCKYMKTLESLEKVVMEECKMTREVLDMIEQDIKYINKNVHDSIKLKEKTSRNEFNYSMDLVYGELFEEFLDEKRRNRLWWEQAMDTLYENNCRALKHLKMSSEAECIQDLAELDLWFEGRCQEIPVVVVDDIETDVVRTKGYVLDVTELNEIDNALSERNVELLVYTNRLKYVLNSYIDFIPNQLRERPSLLQVQLTQAKLLMKNVNKIKTNVKGYNNESRRKRCAQKKNLVKNKDQRLRVAVCND